MINATALPTGGHHSTECPTWCSVPHEDEPTGQHDHQHVDELAPGLLATLTAYDDADTDGPTVPLVTLDLEYEAPLGATELRVLIARATALLAVVEHTAPTPAVAPPTPDALLLAQTARAKLDARVSIGAPELAAMLGIAVSTVHTLARSGVYPSHQPTGVGGARRFTAADVSAIEARGVVQAPRSTRRPRR